jgi:hypothetical protein
VSRGGAEAGRAVLCARRKRAEPSPRGGLGLRLAGRRGRFLILL